MIAALLLALAALAPQARVGYPKLFRCQSAIQRPVPLPEFTPGCLAFRTDELARIRALPPAARRTRVAALRAAIGVQPGEGLEVAGDGSLQAADERDRTR